MEEKTSIRDKSFALAVRIVKLSQYLTENKKESNETIYWLELLEATGYLSKREFDSINADAVSVIKILTKILKSTKNAQTNNQQLITNNQ